MVGVFIDFSLINLELILLRWVIFQSKVHEPFNRVKQTFDDASKAEIETFDYIVVSGFRMTPWSRVRANHVCSVTQTQTERVVLGFYYLNQQTNLFSSWKQWNWEECNQYSFKYVYLFECNTNRNPILWIDIFHFKRKLSRAVHRQARVRESEFVIAWRCCVALHSRRLNNADRAMLVGCRERQI